MRDNHVSFDETIHGSCDPWNDDDDDEFDANDPTDPDAIDIVEYSRSTLSPNPAVWLTQP